MHVEDASVIPVFTKDESFQEPEAPLYYLVASTGVYLVRKTGLFTSVTEVKEVAGLREQSPQIAWHFPRLPRALMERVYGFFDAVYRRWDGEALVLLFYSLERGRFTVVVPRQSIDGLHVRGRWHSFGHMRYEGYRRPEGFLKLGDAHSHADMPAFFSHTDDEDDHEDGLRIVMGRLNRPKPELSVSFVAGRTRFLLEPEQVLEDFSEPVPPPEAWMNQVRCREEERVRDRRIYEQEREV